MVFQYLVYFSYFFKPVPPLPQYYWTWWKPEDPDITSKSTVIHWKGQSNKKLNLHRSSLYTHKYLKPIPISWIIS